MMNEQNKQIRAFATQRVLMLLLDAVLINAAAFFSLFIRHELSMEALLKTTYLHALFSAMAPSTVLSLLAFSIFRIYSSIWEFASERELTDIALASISASAIYMLMTVVMNNPMPRSFPFIMAMFLFLLVAASRFLIRSFINKKFVDELMNIKRIRRKKRTMLIGAGAGSSMAIKEFSTSARSQNQVVCLIDDDVTKHGMRVRGIKVVGGREKIIEAAERYKIDEIVFCIPSASLHVRDEILQLCSQTGVKLKTLPTLTQLANGEITVNQVRDVRIDDLLGRAQVHTDNGIISKQVKGKTVLITGGGGSIGSELCRQVASFDPKKLIIFDIYENNAYYIQQELKKSYPDLPLEVLIGSVRDAERVNYIFDTYRPDMVCHAAAHKHVPLMEDSPAEAIKNNVFGTYNVAKAAGEFGTALFVLVSTDKAVNPTNVMGATKRMCEMIVQSLNACYSTNYIAVRFGNVLGSSGSVIPLFKKQIEEGGPVTVTDKRITRYFMSIPEAVSLILQASAYAKGGEVFVLDMGKPVKIDDLARKMIRLSGFEPDMDIMVEYVGLRPGEKLYEELLLQGEGMEKTDNELIFIGHQTMYTPEEIHEKLAVLQSILKAENHEVRDCILSVIQEPADNSYKTIDVAELTV